MSASNMSCELRMRIVLERLTVHYFTLMLTMLCVWLQVTCMLYCTDTGRAMARYCVAFESMKMFLSLKGSETLADLVC